MANYSIPDNPQYDPQVRKLENSDPANAETVFNPTLSRMVENTAAVKAQLEEHKEDATLHVTEAQKTAWDAKAAADHTHDDRYYTEAETKAYVDSRPTGLATTSPGGTNSINWNSINKLEIKGPYSLITIGDNAGPQLIVEDQNGDNTTLAVWATQIAFQNRSGVKLANVATPTAPGDAVNKAYVDAIPAGLPTTNPSDSSAKFRWGGNNALNLQYSSGWLQFIAGQTAGNNRINSLTASGGEGSLSLSATQTAFVNTSGAYSPISIGNPQWPDNAATKRYVDNRAATLEASITTTQTAVTAAEKAANDALRKAKLATDRFWDSESTKPVGATVNLVNPRTNNSEEWISCSHENNNWFGKIQLCMSKNISSVYANYRLYFTLDDGTEFDPNRLPVFQGYYSISNSNNAPTALLAKAVVTKKDQCYIQLPGGSNVFLFGVGGTLYYEIKSNDSDPLIEEPFFSFTATPMGSGDEPDRN